MAEYDFEAIAFEFAGQLTTDPSTRAFFRDVLLNEAVAAIGAGTVKIRRVMTTPFTNQAIVNYHFGRLATDGQTVNGTVPELKPLVSPFVEQVGASGVNVPDTVI